MSFDLYAIESDEELSLDDIYELLEADSARDENQGPGPRMAALLADLEGRWPGLDDDPDSSPWSSWPLWQPEADAVCGFNIAFSRADEVLGVMVDACRRHGLLLFDPQSEQIHRPKKQRARRVLRWGRGE